MGVSFDDLGLQRGIVVDELSYRFILHVNCKTSLLMHVTSFKIPGRNGYYTVGPRYNSLTLATLPASSHLNILPNVAEQPLY